MADARLVWRELSQTQPNVAPLLGQANDAFNNAADAASGILGRYEAGVKGKNDAEVRQELAAIKDEAGLDKWLAAGGLNGRPVSDDVLGLVSGGRNTIIGYTNDRSIISDRNARTGFAADANSRFNAAEGRTAAEWNDEQARQAWLRQNAAAGLAAEDFTRQYGDTIGPITEQGGAFENYIASTIGSESGGNPNAQNPNSSATGLAQFTDGTWREMMAKHPDLGLTADGRTDPAQAERALRRFTQDNMRFLQSANIPVTEGNLYAAHFLGAGGARAVLTRGDNEQLTDILPSNVIEANPFLRGMSVGRFREWSAQKGGQGQNAAGRTYASPRQSYENSLVQSGLFSAADIARLNAPVDAAAATRTAELEARDAEIVTEQIAAANQALLDNPEINTPEQLRRAVMEDQNFTATENEQRYQNLRGIIADDPSRLRPAISEDPTTVAATVGAVEAASRALDANPQTSLFAQADRLAPDANQSAGQKLAAAVGLDSGNRENPTSWFGNTESGFNQADLDRMVARVATRNQVSEEVAAAAMARAYEDDPWGKNTLANRFDDNKVDEIIKSIGQNDERDYKEARRNVGVLQNHLETLRTHEQLLRAQLAQYPEDSPQRAAIQAQIDAGRQQMSAAEQELSKAQPRNSN